MKAKANLKSGWKEWLKVIIIAVLGILCGAGVDLAVRPTTTEEVVEIEADTTLELTQEPVEATIINEEGQEEVVDVPTVETVDGGEITEEEDGQGAWHDTSSYSAYYNSVGLNNCIQNRYGGQCFSLANDFWTNYAGRALSSCGTGAAKGTTNCYEYNAGSEFEMIWDATQIQPGDWVVFSGGTYGHIGMAMGYYNNGYVSLFGQNQGGGKCSLGGAATNVINKSTKDFIGAFRPKTYVVKAEPKQAETIPVTGCLEWAVKKYDTLSGIMLSCEGTVVYGEAMDAYAASWVSRIVKPGQTVLQGWQSESGVGLYESDIIDHNIDK